MSITLVFGVLVSPFLGFSSSIYVYVKDGNDRGRIGVIQDKLGESLI